MKTIWIFLGIMLPFIGTTFGSSFVFLLKNVLNKKIEILLIGFASGIMISSSIFSLIIPSIEMGNGVLKTSIGFTLGFLLLIIITKLTNRINDKLFFSVTLHNIPEGMADGVSMAAYLVSNMTLTTALLLSLGIALQNIPEGAIISGPLKLKGETKLKSFNYGVLSGIVEPIFSILTILLLNIVVPLLPYLLSFAAGCMIYVVIEELIPRMHEDKSLFGIVGFLTGFLLMMILDVIL